MAWLLSKQRTDGSWDGGIFPMPNDYKKKEDTFCTSEVLFLLREYLDKKKEVNKGDGKQVQYPHK